MLQLVVGQPQFGEPAEVVEDVVGQEVDGVAVQLQHAEVREAAERARVDVRDAVAVEARWADALPFQPPHTTTEPA